jgi:arylsulfatase A
MKKIILTLLLTSLTATLQATDASRPNIVLILIDDMGWKDFGMAGSTYYETPHIDRLSQEGLRFTKGYSAAPVCSPSRGALLTGRYPARTKMTTVWNQSDFPVDETATLHTVAKKGEKNWRRKFNHRFEDARHTHCLPLSETTFAQVLSEHGYVTGYIGKWHCGWHRDFWPDKRGFDYAAGYRTESVRTPHFGRDGIGVLADMDDLKPDDYVGDRLTDKAVAFIHRQGKGPKPFMLVLSHYLVHGPWQGKPSYVQKYQGRPTTDQRNPNFAAMIQSVDESVGRVVKALEGTGLDKDTVLIFTSDNGGPVPVTSNYPLLGGKSYLFEAGMRVPFIVKWPGRVKPGVDRKHRIMHTDLFPTLLDITGIPQKPALHIDGRSFYPLLTQDNTWSQGPVFFHFPHYTHATSPGTALIVDDWKLIRFYNSLEGDGDMLFNLNEDPYELTDLVESHQAMQAKMVMVMEAYLKDTQAELPLPNPDYDSAQPHQLEKRHYYQQALRERATHEKALQGQ